MLKRAARSESGAILVFTALLLLVLVGFAALAVDLGNAWSTNRQSQNASDIGATSGLFAIPRTFSDVPGAPMPIVTAEVQAEIDDLLATNAPGGVAVVSVSTDGLDMTVNVTVDSNNSFGRAIGAGNTISLETTASGHIELPVIAQPNVVRPFSLFNDVLRPYQCLMPNAGSIPPENRPRVCESINGDDVGFLEMYNLDQVRRCSSPSTISNMHDGIDHLIDTAAEHPAAPDPDTRSAQDACSYGHLLTLPNNAANESLTNGQLTSGLTVGPKAALSSPSLPLWELRADGLMFDCADTAFSDKTTVEELSTQMMFCLQSGGARFVPGLIDSDRFSWAIRTSAGPGSSRDFDSLTLLFINSIVSDDNSLTPEQAQTFDGPPAGSGSVGAVTMYELQLGYLDPSDQARLMEPSGTDLLEFSLTN